MPALIDGINAMNGCGTGAQPRYICQASTTAISCIVRCADLDFKQETVARCDRCETRAAIACSQQACKLGLLGNAGTETVRERACAY